jgi:uncharacterized protein with GYD domain
MTTYLMFGKYSIDARGKVSAYRTKITNAVIGESGGILKAAYALLGEIDVVLIAEFPSTEKAMKASVALSKQLGIGFATTPAVSMDDFDKLIVGKEALDER